jgi:L-fuculose-phosphate aldolase
MSNFPFEAAAGDEAALRELICRIGEQMHRQGYIDGASGNISAKLADNRYLATPSGLAKGFMTPDQLIIVDLDGRRIDTPNQANAHLHPTSELSMHMECYRQRPDIGGVVHAHPPHAVALTITGYDFDRCLIPEVVIMLGIIPVTEYATPAGTENRDAIKDLIGEHDALLLAHHGSLTVAPTVWEAYLRLETLEHSCRIFHLVEQLGGPRSSIAPEKVQKLLDLRKQLGLTRGGDDERFRPFLAHSHHAGRD